MNQWQGLSATAIQPPKVKGWRGKGGRGLCKKCAQLKDSEEFPTKTGRVCNECESNQPRDQLGRFTKEKK